MKLNVHALLIGLLILLAMLIFVSCGDDDDDESRGALEDDDDTGYDDDDDDDDDSGDDDSSDDDDAVTGILSEGNQAHIDELTHSKRSNYNSVELLLNGVQSYPLRNKMINGATEHINLQYLVFESNETGYDTAELLAQKASEGVEVNVILDWVSQMFQSDGMGPIDVMTGAGVNVILYDPIWWEWDEFINKRIHVKVLIVDGKEAMSVA